MQDLTDIASLDVGTPEFSQHTLNQVTSIVKIVAFLSV